jgi:hypothetical protein
MGEAAKAVPTTAAPLMKVLLDIFFIVDPFPKCLLKKAQPDEKSLFLQPGLPACSVPPHPNPLPPEGEGMKEGNEKMLLKISPAV